MTDYKKYINSLRKCAKEHEDDRTSFGHIIVSDLCRDTANLLEELEQEPTAKENLVVGDCISRAEAIKALNCKISGSIKSDIDLSKYKREFQEFADIIINAQEKAIQALPPVTPKPKKAHWITWKEAGNDIPSETRFECSVCHDAAQTLCNGLDLLSPFCPNCGAKMESPQNLKYADNDTMMPAT